MKRRSRRRSTAGLGSEEEEEPFLVGTHSLPSPKPPTTSLLSLSSRRSLPKSTTKVCPSPSPSLYPSSTSSEAPSLFSFPLKEREGYEGGILMTAFGAVLAPGAQSKQERKERKEK